MLHHLACTQARRQDFTEMDVIGKIRPQERYRVFAIDHPQHELSADVQAGDRSWKPSVFEVPSVSSRTSNWQ